MFFVYTIAFLNGKINNIKTKKLLMQVGTMSGRIVFFAWDFYSFFFRAGHPLKWLGSVSGPLIYVCYLLDKETNLGTLEQSWALSLFLNFFNNKK